MKLLSLLTTKFNTDKANSPSTEEILAVFNNAPEKTSNKDLLFKLAVNTGSKNLISYITKELNSPDSHKILPLLTGWPDNQITKLLLDNLEAIQPTDKTLRLRSSYTSTIAKIITNPNNLKNPKLKDPCLRFLKLTKNDSELTDVITSMVLVRNPKDLGWKKVLLKSAKTKAKDIKLKAKIEKLINSPKK